MKWGVARFEMLLTLLYSTILHKPVPRRSVTKALIRTLHLSNYIS